MLAPRELLNNAAMLEGPVYRMLALVVFGAFQEVLGTTTPTLPFLKSIFGLRLTCPQNSVAPEAEW